MWTMENENLMPFMTYEVFSQRTEYGEGSVRPRAHRWPYGVSGKQNKLYASISSFQKDKVSYCVALSLTTLKTSTLIDI